MNTALLHRSPSTAHIAATIGFPLGADVIESTTSEFEVFVAADGLKLRRIFTARYGVEVGGDIHAESLAWAWEHWEKLRTMENPVGYLYRVAQSASRPHRRWKVRTSFPAHMPERWHVDRDPTLFASLQGLTDNQRTAVLMVHGHGWSYAEVAEALSCSVPAVTNYVHRGLAILRRDLQEES